MFKFKLVLYFLVLFFIYLPTAIFWDVCKNLGYAFGKGEGIEPTKSKTDEIFTELFDVLEKIFK